MDIQLTSEDLADFKNRTIEYISRNEICSFFDSNGQPSVIPVTGINYDFIAAAGAADYICVEEAAWEAVDNFIKHHSDNNRWIFCALSYDLKNKIEELSSKNKDITEFPELILYVPEILICCKKLNVSIVSKTRSPELILKEISESALANKRTTQFEALNRISRRKYVENLRSLKNHIRKGDIYEINYCEQLRFQIISANPVSLFRQLNEISPNPFSVFFKFHNHFVISASPERFICKIKNKLISQPMKGTARRSPDYQKDLTNKAALSSSSKEISENIMIADLVRNDLSRIASRGSVKVENLCEVISFKASHQMISSVSCEIEDKISFTDIIKATFPMGSMTGAPKISAMKLIDNHESFKRGIFSGSIGYINNAGDFDLNVVIRSIILKTSSKIAVLNAGGAITDKSSPDEEFNELLLKLSPQVTALGLTIETFLED
jgi:para-aminobenzoate synthetase component 1